MPRSRGLEFAASICFALVAPSRVAAAPQTDPSARDDARCRFPLSRPSEVGDEAFEREIYAFLDARCYEELGWMRDASVRDTGPWIEGDAYGSHPSVRIYY